MKTPSFASLVLGLTFLLTACPQSAVPTLPPSLSSSSSSTEGGSAITVTANAFAGTPTFTVSPSTAGTLTVNGLTATFTPDVTFTGTVTVTARSGNQSSSTTVVVTAARSTLRRVTGTLFELGQAGLVAWTRGAGTIDVVGAPNGSFVAFGTGDVTGSGTFALDLVTPTSSQLQPLAVSTPPSCTGTITASDADARGVSASIARVRAGTYAGRAANIDTTTLTATRLTGGQYLYVDRPVRLTGGLTCSGTTAGLAATITNSFDNLVLRQGWNAVVIEATTVRSPTEVTETQTYRNGTAPATWVSIEEQAAPLNGPLGQFLDAHSFDR